METHCETRERQEVVCGAAPVARPTQHIQSHVAVACISLYTVGWCKGCLDCVLCDDNPNGQEGHIPTGTNEGLLTLEQVALRLVDHAHLHLRRVGVHWPCQ
jgi:hypothetical protein